VQSTVATAIASAVTVAVEQALDQAVTQELNLDHAERDVQNVIASNVDHELKQQLLSKFQPTIGAVGCG